VITGLCQARLTTVWVLDERRLGKHLVDQLDEVRVEALAVYAKRLILVLHGHAIQVDLRVPVEERPQPGQIVRCIRVQRAEYLVGAVH
jgi:hypothetical protein